jgi:hypothetical protein
MGDYAEDIAFVAEMIAEDGGPAVWTQHVATPPDPSTPWIPGGTTPVNYTVNLVVFPLNSQMLRSTLSSLASLGYMSGGQVPKGNSQALMPGAVPFTPKLSDTLTIGGRQVEMLGIDTLAPDMGAPVLYLVQLAL